MKFCRDIRHACFFAIHSISVILFIMTALPVSATSQIWKNYTTSNGTNKTVRLLYYASDISTDPPHQTVTETTCRHDGDYTMAVQCPENTKLLYCSGGPSYQVGTDESWSLEPDYTRHRCLAHVIEPVHHWKPGEKIPCSSIVVQAICTLIPNDQNP